MMPSRRISIGVSSQATQSIINFTPALVANRVLSVSDLGQFALFFGAYLTIANALRALLAEPVLLIPREQVPTFADRAIRMLASASGFLLVLGVIGAIVQLPRPFLMFTMAASAAGGMAVREVIRSRAIVGDRVGWSVAGDGAVLMALVGVWAGIARFGDSLEAVGVGMIAVVWIGALGGAAQTIMTVRPRHVRSWVDGLIRAEHLQAGFEALAGRLGILFTILGLYYQLGDSAVGLYEVARLGMSPVGVLLIATTLVLLRDMSQATSADRTRWIITVGVLLHGVVLVWALLLVAEERALNLVLAGNSDLFRTVGVRAFVISLLTASHFAGRLVVKGMRRGDLLLKMGLVGSALAAIAANVFVASGISRSAVDAMIVWAAVVSVGWLAVASISLAQNRRWRLSPMVSS